MSEVKASNKLMLDRAHAAVLSRDYALATRLYKNLIKDEDNEITKNFNLIQKVLNSFKQRKLPIINFGFIIPDKYLQIISNIFYFNLKQSYLIFIGKINTMKNNDTTFTLGYKEKNEIFNNIYSKNLKEVRKKICTFFGIDKDNNLEINVKLALRIYFYYYNKEHNLRKKYQEINDNVNKLLKDLIEHFSSKTLSIENCPEDELGQGYEYLIKQFADDSGHTAQEFYTNRTVVHLMTEMLKPKSGESIYDPTCGSAGMLISAIAFIQDKKLFSSAPKEAR